MPPIDLYKQLQVQYHSDDPHISRYPQVIQDVNAFKAHNPEAHKMGHCTGTTEDCLKMIVEKEALNRKVDIEFRVKFKFRLIGKDRWKDCELDLTDPQLAKDTTIKIEWKFVHPWDPENSIEDIIFRTDIIKMSDYDEYVDDWGENYKFSFVLPTSPKPHNITHWNITDSEHLIELTVTIIGPCMPDCCDTKYGASRPVFRTNPRSILSRWPMERFLNDPNFSHIYVEPSRDQIVRWGPNSLSFEWIACNLCSNYTSDGSDFTGPLSDA